MSQKEIKTTTKGLDLYIQSPVAAEELEKEQAKIAVDPNTKNMAYQIALIVNEDRVPNDMLGGKKGSYTDIILSPYKPYEYWPLLKTESFVLYDLKRKKWVTCSAKD